MVSCFRFNIPEGKQHIPKGFYEYSYRKYAPHSRKTGYPHDKDSCLREASKNWNANIGEARDHMYRFLKWGIAFCQMLVGGKVEQLYQFGGGGANQMRFSPMYSVKRKCMYTHVFVYLDTSLVHAFEFISTQKLKQEKDEMIMHIDHWWICLRREGVKQKQLFPSILTLIMTLENKCEDMYLNNVWKQVFRHELKLQTNFFWIFNECPS